MNGRILEMPWGREILPLQLPENWTLVGIHEPASLPPAPDAAEETRRSLQQPFGSPRLRELAHAGMKVALVVDDGSRPTPAAVLVGAALAELQAAGVARGDITLVPALGVHRPMTEAELAARVGPDNFAGLRWENPDGDDPAKQAFLGVTQRGTPVRIHKTVAEADLVVSVGCIEPHIIASFGGGFKNIVPGVAARETIARNHALNCTPATFNMVGQPIERNPMRLDLEEAGRMLKQPAFVVNAVLDSRQRVVRVVSGDFIAAHREGVRTSAALYGVAVPAPADVVITDSNPMNQDLRQGVKALANTIRAVRRGGVLITLVKADEGVGVFGLASRRLPLGRGALRVLAPLLLKVVPKMKMRGMGEEDRFFLYFALQAMRHATLVIYAPTIPAEVRGNLPFVEFADTPEAAIALARRRLPKGATVRAFPHGGITFPVLD
ncbi:MAG: nickel-dependent lactate racemase [Chloroflexi bacterium]|nr:nickel-dependent lactate racemase [Chloroflexota bacterium]